MVIKGLILSLKRYKDSFSSTFIFLENKQDSGRTWDIPDDASVFSLLALGPNPGSKRGFVDTHGPAY